MSAIVVTGTDTDVGKTVFAAGLAAALNASYWKPVQSGLDSATDTETVVKLAGCAALPEAYRLPRPASPHLSAEDIGIEIDPARLALPDVSGPMVVEGAGGVMVPLNRQVFFLDIMAMWRAPVIVVARTLLGTINHTTLTVRALQSRGCPVVGVVFNGPPEPQVEQTICDMNETAHLGRLDRLDKITPAALQAAFKAIDLKTIRSAL